jgi:uncharacterized membrane protein
LFALYWFGYSYCIIYSIFQKIKTTIMKKNMGNIDRIIRIIIAAVVSVLYFTGTISGTVGIVLLVLAGVFLVTSLVSFCPLYAIVGLNTCPVKK